MSTLRMLQASTVAAIFLLGSTAWAEDYGSGTTEMTKTTPQQDHTARAGGASNQEGQTSGPAQGTNVKPTQGPAAAGEPGTPGMPGNKNGPAVMPPKQQQER